MYEYGGGCLRVQIDFIFPFVLVYSSMNVLDTRCHLFIHALTQALDAHITWHGIHWASKFVYSFFFSQCVMRIVIVSNKRPAPVRCDEKIMHNKWLCVSCAMCVYLYAHRISLTIYLLVFMYLRLFCFYHFEWKALNYGLHHCMNRMKTKCLT